LFPGRDCGNPYAPEDGFVALKFQPLSLLIMKAHLSTSSASILYSSTIFLKASTELPEPSIYESFNFSFKRLSRSSFSFFSFFFFSSFCLAISCSFLIFSFCLKTSVFTS